MESAKRLTLCKQEIRCTEPGCGVAMTPSNLRQHLATKKHGFTADEIKQKVKAFNDSLKAKKATLNGTNVHRCEICGHKCGSKSGITEHMRTDHPNQDRSPDDEPIRKKYHLDTDVQDDLEIVSDFTTTDIVTVKNDTGKLVCPDESCNFHCTNRENLCEHFNEAHGVCEVERHEFGTYVEYQEWKDQMSMDSCTSLRIKNTKEDGATKYVYEICQHEGEYKSTGNEQRFRKSKKLTGKNSCLAFLKTIISTDKIAVVGCFGHIGHKQSASKQKLTEQQKQEIVAYMKDDFTNRQIIKKYGKHNDYENRMYWLTNDDLRQIRKNYDLLEERLDKDDLISLQKRIEQEREEDGFRFYSPPLNRTGEGFVLVIITPRQLELLKKYSHRGISIDDTHNTTMYSLKLTTVMILNGFDKGFPVAYMISYSVSQDEVGKLFEEIKKLHPAFNPRYFISDDASAFFNGFAKVFSNSRAQKQLCQWHAYTNWKKHARDCLKDPHLTTVLTSLYDCMKCPTIQDMDKIMVGVLQYLEDVNTAGSRKMFGYLRSYYFDRSEEWAAAFRLNSIFNTTMFNESWHSFLKMHVLERVMNNRLDKLVAKLYEAFDSIVRTNLKQVERGIACPRKSANHSNCRRAKKELPLNNIKKKTPVKFEVSHRTQQQGAYEVTDNLICECEIEENTHCVCGACEYRYKCNCYYQKKGVACKHIHMIMILGAQLTAEDEGCCIETVGVGANEEIVSVDLVPSYPGNQQTIASLHSGPSTQATSSSTIMVNNVGADSESLNVKYDRLKGNLRTLDNHFRGASKKPDGNGSAFDDVNNFLQSLIDKYVTPSSHLQTRDLDEPAQTARESMHLQKRTRPSKKNNVAPRLVDIQHRNSISICGICHLGDPILPADAHPEELEMRETSWRRCPSCKLAVHMTCAMTNKTCRSCNQRYVDYEVTDDEEE